MEILFESTNEDNTVIEERSDDKTELENISKTYYLKDGTKVLVWENLNFVSKPGRSGDEHGQE